jgi:hypothetical protein
LNMALRSQRKITGTNEGEMRHNEVDEVGETS